MRVDPEKMAGLSTHFCSAFEVLIVVSLGALRSEPADLPPWDSESIPETISSSASS